jgi:hypothetical protein
MSLLLKERAGGQFVRIVHQRLISFSMKQSNAGDGESDKIEMGDEEIAINGGGHSQQPELQLQNNSPENT